MPTKKKIFFLSLSNELMELVHDCGFPLVVDCQCDVVICDFDGGNVGVTQV